MVGWWRFIYEAVRTFQITTPVSSAFLSLFKQDLVVVSTCQLVSLLCCNAERTQREPTIRGHGLSHCTFDETFSPQSLFSALRSIPRRAEGFPSFFNWLLFFFKWTRRETKWQYNSACTPPNALQFFLLPWQLEVPHSVLDQCFSNGGTCSLKDFRGRIWDLLVLFVIVMNQLLNNASNKRMCWIRKPL